MAVLGLLDGEVSSGDRVHLCQSSTVVRGEKGICISAVCEEASLTA